MCKTAKEFAQEMKFVYAEIYKERTRLGNIVHACDLRSTDILHLLEFNGTRGMYDAYKTIKELKEIRQIRRKCKIQIRILKVLLDADYKKILDNIDKIIEEKANEEFNLNADCKLSTFEDKYGGVKCV